MDLHNVQRVIAINVVLVKEMEELIGCWALQERHAELDVLCIGGHVSSALEAPDMVTSADSSGVRET